MVLASYVARNPERFTLFTGPSALKLYVEEMPEKLQMVVAKMDRPPNATNIAIVKEFYEFFEGRWNILVPSKELAQGSFRIRAASRPNENIPEGQA